MHERTTEERFEAAARNVCERWESFDFVRHVQSGDSRLPVRYEPDCGEFVPHRAGSLNRDIDDIGGLAAIKRRLHTESEGDALHDLGASNRLDLTVEFLALRPAWKSLFNETERRTAAERLRHLLSLSFPDVTTPSAVDDLDLILDWLLDKIARWEVDPDLPKSRVSYGWPDPSSRKEQTWCDSVADTAREFSEIGLITTSLTQCNHYLHCAHCIGAFPELERHFRRFERTTISQCHELLKLLGVCLERVFKDRDGKGWGGIVGQGDEFAWRAIVCGAGLMYNDSLREFSRILSEVERGHIPASALHRQLLDLNQDELHLLAFAEAASSPFIEMQWFLYGNDDLVYLPSDGDLWDIPQLVVVLNAPEIGEWKRLMTGSDLEFPKRNRDGRDSTLSIDGNGLFLVLNSAAALRSEKYSEALASTIEIVRARTHEPRAERIHLGLAAGSEEQEEREGRTEELRPAPIVEPVDSSIAGASRDSSMKLLLDRMTELHDLVASNSAAQVPIIDTLQSVLSKIVNPSRYGAEESLRRELGNALYDDLTPTARHWAIAAEYCWLDANAPDPSRIVAALATAFEHQLRETVFTRFCGTLLASGLRNYPEPPGVPPLPGTGSPSVRPRPGLPVQSGSDMPKLLENGRITRLLTFGTMEGLLDRPLPALTNFLAQHRIQIQELMKVLPEIRVTRNRAVHDGHPSLREEASQIRSRWLGKTDVFPNIFALLVPGSSAANATDTGR
jgi:hypothetical protein